MLGSTASQVPPQELLGDFLYIIDKIPILEYYINIEIKSFIEMLAFEMQSRYRFFMNYTLNAQFCSKLIIHVLINHLKIKGV